MRKLVLAFSTLALVACSNGGGGPADASAEAAPDAGATSGCTGDFDCPSGSDHCYFAVNGDCSAPVGTCQPYTAPANCTPVVACGCDGTTISVCAPAGYVDRPAAAAGACPPSLDAGSDAADDATSDAASD